MTLTFAAGKVPNIDTGTYQEYKYEIINPTSTTAALKIYIPDGQSVKAIPGCMFVTSSNIEIKGKIKKTLKAVLGPDEARYQTFTAKAGEGWVLLSPSFYGAISPIRITNEEICVGDNAFLASIGEIESTSKSQGLRKAIFSGHGMFVKKVKGTGVIFVCAVGAMMTFNLKENENIVVGNGHLVTWSNMKHDMKMASKGWFSSGLSGEGIISSMTGPGRINVQTRSPKELVEWVYETKPPATPPVMYRSVF